MLGKSVFITLLALGSNGLRLNLQSGLSDVAPSDLTMHKCYNCQQAMTKTFDVYAKAVGSKLSLTNVGIAVAESLSEDVCTPQIKPFFNKYDSQCMWEFYEKTMTVIKNRPSKDSALESARVCHAVKMCDTEPVGPQPIPSFITTKNQVGPQPIPSFITTKNQRTENIDCSFCQTILSKYVHDIYQPGEMKKVLDHLEPYCEKLPFPNVQEKCVNITETLKFRLEKIDEKKQMDLIPQMVCYDVNVCDVIKPVPIIKDTKICEACQLVFKKSVAEAMEKAEKAKGLCEFFPKTVYQTCIDKAEEEIEKVGKYLKEFPLASCQRMKFCEETKTIEEKSLSLLEERPKQTESDCGLCQSVFEKYVEDSKVGPEQVYSLVLDLEKRCEVLPFRDVREKCVNGTHNLESQIKDFDESKKMKVIPQVLCKDIGLCNKVEPEPLIEGCEACKQIVTKPFVAALEAAEKGKAICEFFPAFSYKSCIDKANEAIDSVKQSFANVPQTSCKRMELCK